MVRMLAGLVGGSVLVVMVSWGARPGTSAHAQVDEGYVPPVAALVADPFRAPTSFAGPGNRGLEYATGGGEVVVAAGAGVVAFAGNVGGVGVVSITHPDGLRTTYTRMQAIEVVVGELVERSARIGIAGRAFHFGARAGGGYLDPAELFAASSVGSHLVPVDSPTIRLRVR